MGQIYPHLSICLRADDVKSFKKVINSLSADFGAEISAYSSQRAKENHVTFT